MINFVGHHSHTNTLPILILPFLRKLYVSEMMRHMHTDRETDDTYTDMIPKKGFSGSMCNEKFFKCGFGKSL